MFVFITLIVCYVCVYHTHSVLCLCLGFESCNNNDLDLGHLGLRISTNFIYRKANDGKRYVIFNIYRVGTVREDMHISANAREFGLNVREFCCFLFGIFSICLFFS